MDKISDRLTELFCCKCLSKTKKLYIIKSLGNHTEDWFYCRKCATKKIRIINKIYKKLVNRCKKCRNYIDGSCNTDCNSNIIDTQEYDKSNLTDNFEPINSKYAYLKDEDYYSIIFDKNGKNKIDL